MFLGLSATGINREVAFTIESANQCARKTVRCLAIPRAAVMKMADQIAELGDDDGEKGREEDFEYQPSSRTIARGILPSLRHIVRQELGEIMDEGTKDVEPDCEINTLGTEGAIDPNGSDYFCILCHAELCNLYYRCQGCEKLLNKDYNICFRCYNKKLYTRDMEMGLDKDNEHSKINWTSIRHHTVRSKKPTCGAQKCKRTICDQCKECWECRCRCHEKFKEHRRFYSKKRLNKLIQKCKEHMKGDQVPFARETEKRLDGQKVAIKESVKVPSPYYPTARRIGQDK